MSDTPHSPTDKRPPGRVNEIDLLRFVASMLVLLFHYAFRGMAADNMAAMNYPWLAPVFKYGFLGVQLFFLISGFVILMSAAGGSVRGFIVSRVIRLYPAFWAACTITYLVCIAWGGPTYAASFKQYLINMTMISDYLHTPAIDGVYWSLSLEIRFYVLITILLMIRQIHRAEFFLIAWLVATIALEWHPIGKLRFLLISDYATFFIGGATIYLVWSKGLSIQRALMILCSLILGIIQSIKGLAEFGHYYHTEMDPVITGLLVTSFYAILLLVALRKTGALAGMRWITAGALTYPLYLLHQNIGYIIFNHAHGHLNIHLIFWGTIALMLAGAWLIHNLIEQKAAPVLKRVLNRTLDTFSQLTPSKG
ncbi:MAG TPA: acyltransferase [Aquabacterium sp.]|uniref:acyltransferase family protein n=1 Tax=Aquabacterium sp. TaxID=1872578 RepID=UPI002E2F3339|nr:acyltransferase [Aquabacterium sp.]HEX5358049.1 acyltransferase [Aquabacterium sp.]